METRKIALLSLLLTFQVLDSGNKQPIIFCKTKNSANLIAEFLVKNDFICCVLHGDLDQKIRMNLIISFNNNTNIIVLTHVVAREMDFKEIYQTINFELNVNFIEFCIKMEKISELINLYYVFYDKKEDDHLKEQLKKYFTRTIGTID
uniref:Helicase C-terminal domain-containing protein n=1 Tax=Strongyloides papillosus TaxID=174720 RepID=A0A0N5BBJ3_STREA